MNTENPKNGLPDKEMFLSQPRSKEIRKVCLEILRVLHRLMNDESIQGNRENFLKAIELQKKRLIELGITKDVHVGSPPGTFIDDPIKAAEYLAGQIIATLDQGKFLHSDEILAGSETLIATNGSNPKGVSFVSDNELIKLIMAGFDATDEVLSHEAPPNVEGMVRVNLRGVKSKTRNLILAAAASAAGILGVYNFADYVWEDQIAMRVGEAEKVEYAFEDLGSGEYIIKKANTEPFINMETTVACDKFLQAHPHLNSSQIKKYFLGSDKQWHEEGSIVYPIQAIKIVDDTKK